MAKGRVGSKGASQAPERATKNEKKEEISAEAIFDEYRYAWCLHQLLPYIDKVLGISGTMDFRPIKLENDIMCRLPLVLLCLIMPPSRGLMLAAHLANVISMCFWMPSVWDHCVWVMLMESVFVVAGLVSSTEKETMTRFLWAIRPMLIVLYFSAAFWKLTTSFLDPRSSCANTLVAELAAGLFSPEQMPADSQFAKYLMLSAPAQIVGIEFLVPIVLWLCPRPGIPIALAFHGTINLMPLTYAGGFSIAMCSRLYFFMPGTLVAAFRAIKKNPFNTSFIASIATIAVFLALYLKSHSGQVDASGAAFFGFSLLYLQSSYQGYLSASDTYTPSQTSSLATRLVWTYAFALAWIYGFLAPIFSFMSMASSTMYGNVIQWGGRPNHILVPTGLLHDWFRDDGPDWLVDAFGGGIIRVDAYNSSEFYSQLDGADISNDQPDHAKAILAATGSSGKYYEFYASRNYYDRPEDHAATALTAFDDKATVPAGVTKFAFPAYELRRVLYLARNRETDFSLEYTHLPPHLHTLSEWRDYESPRTISFIVRDGIATCDSLGQTSEDILPCDADETALLPPPPQWLRSLYHPYPLPLLDGVGNEFVCTT